MLRDESEAAVSGGDGNEGGGTSGHRLRAPRRKLPLGRGGTLLIDGRTHIVGLADLSATGAYLITRVHLRLGEEVRLVLLPGGGELAVRAQVVRVVQDGKEDDHHPRGVAVHFLDLDRATRARLEAFVKAGSSTAR